MYPALTASITLHPRLVRLLDVAFLVVRQVSLVDSALRKLDGLSILQFVETRLAPVVVILWSMVVPGITANALASTPAVAVVHRRFIFNAILTAEEAIVNYITGKIEIALNLCNMPLICVIELLFEVASQRMHITRLGVVQHGVVET